MNVSDEQIRTSFRKEQSLTSIARLRDDMGTPAPKRRKNKVITDECLIKLWQCYDEGLLDVPSFLKAAGLRIFQRPPKRTNSNPSTGAIVAAIIGASIGFVLLVCCCGILCTIFILIPSFYTRLKTPNPTVTGIHNVVASAYRTRESIFVPGTYASYYSKNGSYRGPFYMTLGFYNTAGYMVYGKGKDDVASYAIKGFYSPITRRMGLQLHYQIGTGDPDQNIGQTISVHVQWNEYKQQFEGNYYSSIESTGKNNHFTIKRH
ncbi:unnamed protein product [Rotaria magnacalcarata]